MDILTPDQWGATAGRGGPMRLPAIGVHVHHSVTAFDDDGDHAATDDVAADMREIERIGVSRFGLFPYSFCGHPSGWVGEGAGLRQGAHTSGWNSTTFGFCMIGNYQNDHLTDAQVRAFVEWRAWMVDNGWLRPDHWIEPHQARKATACPGDNTMARWPELTVDWSEGIRPDAPPPPPPPVPEEDDMLLIENADVDRGIWFLSGSEFFQIAHHETVSALLSAGVKGAKWKDADFEALRAATGADVASAEASALSLEAIRAKLEA